MVTSLVTYVIIQSFLLAIALFVTGKKHNRWLAGIFIVYLIRYGFGLIMMLNTDLKTNMYLIFFEESVDAFLLGIIATYCSIMLAKQKITWEKWLLFLPGIMYLVFLVGFKLNIYNDKLSFFKSSYFSIACLVFMLVYFVFLIIQIKLLKKGLKGSSDISIDKRISLYWMLYFLRFNTFLAVITILYYLPSEILLSTYLYTVRAFLGEGMLVLQALFMLIMGYVAIKTPISDKYHTPLSSLARVEERVMSSVMPNEEKPNRNTLTDEEIQKLSGLIKEALYSKKAFLNNDLNLKRAAELCNLQPYKLSYIVNTHWQKNFNELINEWRVEYAKEMLISNYSVDIKMYTLALDSGFNSEATFYKHFKKLTGFTPSQFKEQNSDRS